MQQAAHEPTWIDNCYMDLDKWNDVVDSFRKLALRSAALESLLEVWHYFNTTKRFQSRKERHEYLVG